MTDTWEYKQGDSYIDYWLFEASAGNDYAHAAIAAAVAEVSLNALNFFDQDLTEWTVNGDVYPTGRGDWQAIIPVIIEASILPDVRVRVAAILREAGIGVIFAPSVA